jgi:hypothetical protein
MNRQLLDRIGREAGVPGLADLLVAMPGTDLNSLLLEVLRARSRARTAEDLLDGRELFAASDLDGRAFLRLIDELYTAAPAFEAVELSPICPLGTNQVLGGIDQMNVLAALRGAEVVADPTTAMALIAARRGDPAVRLCASARPLRLQPIPAGSGYTPHFRQLALVSAGRIDPMAALEEQLTVWLRFLERLAPLGYLFPDLEVAITVLDDRQVLDELFASLGASFPAVRFRLAPERQQGRGYYETLAITLASRGIAFGDGGFTSWLARLRHDRKQRFLGTGIGVDALLRHFRGG